MKIAFPGERGEYAEATAALAFGSDDITTRPCRTITAVFEGVGRGLFNYGVVPLESSSTGSLMETYENLRLRPIFIRHQIRMRTDYVLAGMDGSSFKTLKEVTGHPASLLACEPFFRAHPNLSLRASFEMAGVDEAVLKGRDTAQAVLISSFAARMRGLHIVREQCAGPPDLWMTYIVISRTPDVPRVQQGEQVLNTVACYVPHAAGSLLKVMQAFGDERLNIVGQKTWLTEDRKAACFFTIHASALDEPMKRAFKVLEERGCTPRHVGTFVRREVSNV